MPQANSAKTGRAPGGEAATIPDTSSRLSFTPESLEHLAVIRKWAFFLSVLGFIGAGFMVLFGIMFAVIIRFAEGLGQLGLTTSLFVAVLYAGGGVAYFFPAYFLFRFSDRMKHALTWNDTGALTAALRHLRSHYVFIGVAIIVLVALYVLIIVGILVFVLTAGIPGDRYYS